MNFFITGFQEAVRRLRRKSEQERVAREQALLDKAEISLGQLGWEQVDFPPAVQEQINMIQTVERQQAKFSNQSAAIQGSIDELIAKREQDRQQYGDSVVALEEQLQAWLEAQQRLTQSIAGLQAGVGRFEQAVYRLDARYEEAIPRLQELRVARPQTRWIQKQMVELEDLRLGYDADREDLVNARRKLQHEIKATSEQIENSAASVEQLKQAIAEAKGESSAKEEEFDIMVSSLEEDKEQTSKTVDSLDSKKEPAYLAIGRCLADHKIAPRNQPDALKAVLQHRELLRKYQFALEDSLAASAQAGSSMIAFFAVLAFLLAAIAVGLFVLMTHKHA